MLDEKNDNLPENEQMADGQLSNVDTTAETATTTAPEEDETVTIAEAELGDESRLNVDKQQQAVIDIENSNAEESEDETLKDRHNIPMEDYEALSMEELVSSLEKLVEVEKTMSVKEHVEELKKSFLSKYIHFMEEKKEQFTVENPESTEDFRYDFPLKHTFDKLYSSYREKKNTHFKSLQNNLASNLETRLAIVEELKELINPQDNIKDSLKHFNELRDRWKNAGSIPKDKYNHVWNNYHFHVENFYDYLHLDREARDLDFKHNLEQKEKIVARVEELIHEDDINKAFRELQDLHRIWKEDIGPVSQDKRDEIWNKFSDLTKQMHDKREVLFEKQRSRETENLEKKQEIVRQLEELSITKVGSHSAWLAQIEKVEALRNSFFTAGKVPQEHNEATWSAFKNAVRNFNALKNSFYKDIKKDQSTNLSKKTALVEKAKELQNSEDFAATTPIMKQIQDEWKQIGHVPKKYSDKLWKEFKTACNHYFDKLKEQRNEANTEEVEAFENKKNYLDSLKDFELSGSHKEDLDAIKGHIEKWKTFGRVPQARRHIEGKFNKVLDVLFDKLSLSKKDSDMLRFANRMEQLSDANDSRKIEGEKIFLSRKIDEVQSEIFQLENNIQFFANAKKDNPILAEVHKNIARHREELDTLKEKLHQVRSIKTE